MSSNDDCPPLDQRKHIRSRISSIIGSHHPTGHRIVVKRIKIKSHHGKSHPFAAVFPPPVTFARVHFAVSTEPLKVETKMARKCQDQIMLLENLARPVLLSRVCCAVGAE